MLGFGVLESMEYRFEFSYSSVRVQGAWEGRWIVWWGRDLKGGIKSASMDLSKRNTWLSTELPLGGTSCWRTVGATTSDSQRADEESRYSETLLWSKICDHVWRYSRLSQDTEYMMTLHKMKLVVSITSTLPNHMLYLTLQASFFKTPVDIDIG